MHKFFSMTALVLGLSMGATAADARAEWGSDLRFIANTTTPAPNGSGTVAVCHLVNYASGLFIPVYTSIQGYALSNDGCTGDTYREVNSEQFAAMQASGVIPADLPAVPSVDVLSLIWGHAWLVLGAVAVLIKGAGFLMARRNTKAKSPNALAIHSLIAMSQVAIADGRIEDTEVRQISHILTRLTGTSYSPDHVMRMLQELNPSASDLAQVGENLSSKDRQIVLEAALNIAVADGEIHANEYAVVSELAHRMRIGSDQFRSTLARLSAHLQTMSPA